MTKTNIIAPFDSINEPYHQFLETAKTKILSVRIRIAKAACQEQVNLYLWFGRQAAES